MKTMKKNSLEAQLAEAEAPAPRPTVHLGEAMTYHRGDQLTVAQVITLLQKCDPNALVEVEGCDCEGDCRSVVVMTGRVLLARTANDGDALVPEES